MTTKNRFRPTRRAVALEPRLLFDGAGAVAAFDAAVDSEAHKGQEQQPKAAAPAAFQAPNIFANAQPRFMGEAFTQADNWPSRDFFGRLMTMSAETSEADVKVTGGTVKVVGEDDENTNIGQGLIVSGKGDNLSVTVTVEHGTLNGGSSSVTFTGSAADIQAHLNALTYTYTGDSETGATDKLKVNGVEVREIKVAPQNDAPTFAEKDKEQGEFHITIKENRATDSGLEEEGKYVVVK